MVDSQDILKELEIKNREIYLNKLNVDLDNNYEILEITLNNMFTLYKEEMFNKMTFLGANKELVSNYLDKFINDLENKILSLIKNKITVLKNSVNDIDNIAYKEIIDDETIKCLSRFKLYYDNLINELINNIENKDNERMNEYLKTINYEKIFNKFKEVLINMDTILYNNYLESIEKFNNLNEKTLK